MAIAPARTPFPAATVPATTHDGRGAITITAYAPEDHRWRWEATLRVDLRRERPTPVLRSLRIPIETDDQAPSPVYLHNDALFVLHQEDTALRCEQWRWLPTPKGTWKLHPTPILQLTKAPANPARSNDHSAEDFLKDIGPLQVDAHGHWRLDIASLFAHFLDAGWNLPIRNVPGALRLHTTAAPHTTDRAEFPQTPWENSTHDASSSTPWSEFQWSAEDSTSPLVDAADTMPPRILRALENYRLGLPIEASVLSATTFADAHGATLSMQLADAAIQQHDSATLHTLEITQQRILARGQAHSGNLAALISIYSARQQHDAAHQHAQILYQHLAQSYQDEALAEWLREPIDTWLQPSGDHAPLRAPTPTGTAARSTAAPPRTNLFERALSAFEGDDDPRAWALVCEALDHREPIRDEATASMILRLLGREEDPSIRHRALRAIIANAPSEDHDVRATQLLATDHDMRGEFEQAHAVLQQGRERFPSSVLLAVAHAQLLSRNGHPDAVQAWQHVLIHPALEPWEVAEYTQERDAARAWLNQQNITPEPATTPPIDPLEALERLFFDTPPDPRDIDAHLTQIKDALSARPEPEQRATLLAQRAVLYLLHKDYDRAAQSWTGALILRADDPKILAGVAFTRQRQHPEKPHDDIRQRFRRAYKRHRKQLSDDERNALHTLYEHA